MPWQECTVVSSRVEFCALAVQPGANVSTLCRRYGISRKTGYKWLARARSGEPGALVDRSRRPCTAPARTDPATEAQVIALRTAHPTWGGRKLRRRLQDQGVDPVPAASTITEILRRVDLLGVEAGIPRAFQRFEAEAPNALWQLDFTGHFPLAVGRCHPLPVLDDHSRFLLGLAACGDEQAATVHTHLTTLFRRYGLPWRLLCDNGPPWGSAPAPHQLTGLAVWLIRLGIGVLHGRPFHPQTQGKLERVNRTLLADVVRPTGLTSLVTAQRAFDTWRAVYNEQRPHEALGLATPLSRYAPSPRPFPETLPPVAYEPGAIVRMVDVSGRMQFRGHRWRVSHALAGQPIALRPTNTDGVFEVVFCHHTIRSIDLRAGPESP